jgi:proline dehydrogenase
MSAIETTVSKLLPLIPKPVVRRAAFRYIAGEQADDALAAVSGLNTEGLLATLDILGEHVSNKEGARTAAKEYIELLRMIHEHSLKADIAVKLTHFGLHIDKAGCYELIQAVAREAGSLDNSVWIDMEDSACTDDTLAAYKSIRASHPDTGIALQAYLRRTACDINHLTGAGAKVRLCKGIYREPWHLAYREPAIINANYLHLAKRLIRAGAYVAFATHDEMLTTELQNMVSELGVKQDQYEFQMLLGVRSELRSLLLAAGHRVRVYVPYGSRWHAYSLRRLRENPRVTGYVLKSLLAPQRKRRLG